MDSEQRLWKREQERNLGNVDKSHQGNLVGNLRRKPILADLLEAFIGGLPKLRGRLSLGQGRSERAETATMPEHVEELFRPNRSIRTSPLEA